MHIIDLTLIFFGRDISGNHLDTLHKDTFKGLTHLVDLDMSNNRIDFLPFDIFNDLHSVHKMFVYQILNRTFFDLLNH